MLMSVIYCICEGYNSFFLFLYFITFTNFYDLFFFSFLLHFNFFNNFLFQHFTYLSSNKSEIRIGASAAHLSDAGVRRVVKSVVVENDNKICLQLFKNSNTAKLQVTVMHTTALHVARCI